MCHFSNFQFVQDSVSPCASNQKQGLGLIFVVSLRSIIGTAFAYGQTSSGKTFTMNGSGADPGIIRLAVRDVFDKIKMVCLYMDVFRILLKISLVMSSQFGMWRVINFCWNMSDIRTRVPDSGLLHGDI